MNMVTKQEIRKKKIYIASPFFNEEQLTRVKLVEQALDNNPFVDQYFSPRQEQLTHLPLGSKAWSNAVFTNDVNNIDWADVVVAVHDFDGETTLHGSQHGHVDSGTAFELGYAYATGKPVVLIHEKGGIVNLMLSESSHAYLTKAVDVEEYNFITMPHSEYTGTVI